MGSPGSSGRHVREAVLGNAGGSRLSQVMAATARYKGNRSLGRVGEKSEGRVVPERPGNGGGGKAPCFHQVS